MGGKRTRIQKGGQCAQRNSFFLFEDLVLFTRKDFSPYERGYDCHRVATVFSLLNGCFDLKKQFQQEKKLNKLHSNKLNFFFTVLLRQIKCDLLVLDLVGM